VTGGWSGDGAGWGGDGDRGIRPTMKEGGDGRGEMFASCSTRAGGETWGCAAGDGAEGRGARSGGGEPGSITPHKRFRAELYVLTKRRGRHTPFFGGTGRSFSSDDGRDGVGDAGRGVEMVIPGDNTNLEVELITPIAMERGLRFAIREGGRTVGAGSITDILEIDMATRRSAFVSRLRLPAAGPVRDEIVDTAQRTGHGSRAPPPAHPHPAVHRACDRPTRQEVRVSQFEIRTHKRLLDILEPTQQTIDALMKLELPAGVESKSRRTGEVRAIWYRRDSRQENRNDPDL